MPQVARSLVKERAARLREKGADALSRFLAAQAGSEVEVLMERDGVGRTRQFAEISLASRRCRRVRSCARASAGTMDGGSRGEVLA